MKLEARDVKSLVTVLESIEDGRIDVPIVPGQIGQFLRQFSDARATALARFGLQPAAREWVSGGDLMELDLLPITPLDLRSLSDVVGSVTSTVAVSETIATTLRMVLWGGGRAADRLLRRWRRAPASVVRLRGAYRWYPPARITPGEATVEFRENEISWREVRCLKYTGDDLGRAPLASAFHADLSLAPIGIKAFRSFVVTLQDGSWVVAPGYVRVTPQVEVKLPSGLRPEGARKLLVLAWAQAWDPFRWQVVAAEAVDDDGILAHNIAWADHIRELQGEDAIPGTAMVALERCLWEAGHRSASATRACLLAPLGRSVDARARPFAAWLRGVS